MYEWGTIDGWMDGYGAESECMRWELGFALDFRLFSCYHYTMGLRISIKHWSRLLVFTSTDRVHLPDLSTDLKHRKGY
jgi:hypothetical protein